MQQHNTIQVNVSHSRPKKNDTSIFSNDSSSLMEDLKTEENHKQEANHEENQEEFRKYRFTYDENIN